MSIRDTLARLIGVRDDQVEDALQDERRAKRQLSRRGLLLAGAAVAAGQFVGVERAYSYSLAPVSGESLWKMSSAFLQVYVLSAGSAQGGSAQVLSMWAPAP